MAPCTGKPRRRSLRIELSPEGYIRIARAEAEHFFPQDTLLLLREDETLVLLPTREAAAGGKLLKRRNADGDRSLLISEVFEHEIPSGSYIAVWDDLIGGLRIRLPPDPPGQERTRSAVRK